jgi:hypothetical protein
MKKEIVDTKRLQNDEVEKTFCVELKRWLTQNT